MLEFKSSGTAGLGTPMPPAQARPTIPIFPDVERMIIVPIGVEVEKFGLLDLTLDNKAAVFLCRAGSHPFGAAIGNLSSACHSGGSQRKAVEDAEDQKRQETQANEDFAHQLRTPIAEAQIRIELALDASHDEEERRRLRVLRGLFRRTERVAMSMRLLSELSSKQPLTLKRRRLDCDQLLKKIIELADDAQIANASKFILFRVERAASVLRRSMSSRRTSRCWNR
jgi:signal transduction histidine kinase